MKIRNDTRAGLMALSLSLLLLPLVSDQRAGRG